MSGERLQLLLMLLRRCCLQASFATLLKEPVHTDPFFSSFFLFVIVAYVHKYSFNRTANEKSIFKCGDIVIYRSNGV